VKDIYCAMCFVIQTLSEEERTVRSTGIPLLLGYIVLCLPHRMQLKKHLIQKELAFVGPTKNTLHFVNVYRKECNFGD